MYHWQGLLKYKAIKLRQFVYDYSAWVWRYRSAPIRQKTFSLNGKNYHYFVHPYNHTWANERIVEIPIVGELFQTYQGRNILEIGNVLSHYFVTYHDVLDKYERTFRQRIINEDILAYTTPKLYDFICSISTLEHIGWDETPHNPSKVLAAIEKIMELLNNQGKAIFSIPVGHNPFLDEAIKTHRIEFSEIFCLKRISAENEWISVALDIVMNCKYNSPFPNANGIIIGFFNK